MKLKEFLNEKSKTFLAVFICTLSFSFSQAQKITVKGSVTGEGELLPGVSIVIKGTSNGTTTDFDGNYKIVAAPTDMLVFSYMGYATKSIIVGSKSKINVTLKNDTSVLDEIVVVGYGTQKKKELTGAVSQIKSDEIMKTATSDLSSALQGQIAGVTVVASDGAPGSEANVMIRGLTSINGGNKPLYVVDGIPFEGDPKLSTSEVESIDVLKDAASAAIYGTRGAAGVILITTKKGKEGTMKIRAESYYGVQNITSSTYIMDANDRLYSHFLQSWAVNGNVYGNTWHSAEQNPTQLTNNTNLINYVTNDSAPIENYSLTLSGGQNGLTYNIVGNFFSQDGTVINSSYERFNVRTNAQMKKGNWNVTSGLSFRVEDKQNGPWGILRDAYRYQALQVDLEDNLESIGDAGDGSSANNLSYLGRKLLQEDNEERQYFDGNISIAYNFNKNLKFTSRLAAGWENATRRVINPEFIAYDWEGEPLPGEQSKIYNFSSTSKRFSWENIINYKKSFGKHNFNFVGVYSAERYNYTSFYAQKFDINSNEVTVLNGATGDSLAGSGTGQWNQDRENTLIGMLARLQYNYKGKYLFSASVRRDGSSRFKSQPWGVFPSFSAGWNVSDEDFWKPIKNTIRSLKIRASYGTTGNQGIADYAYSPTITLENDYVFGNDADQNLQLGAIQQGYANELVSWETSISKNIGFDMSFLQNKLTFTGDYYQTNKEDMLFPVYLPPTVGAGSGNDSSVVLNVGDMENNGVEFALNYKSRGKVSWNAGINFTKNTNKVTKMTGANKIIYFNDSNIAGSSNDRDYVSVLAEGYEGGAFFLIKTDGVIQSEEELATYLGGLPTSTAKIGDLKLVDALTVDTNNDGIPDAGDGVIDINDRQYSGSGTPEFEIGFNTSANYKNFDISAQFYGAFGGEIMNGSKAFAYQYGNHQDQVYQWSPQNPTSEIPVYRGSQTHDNVRGFSDFWLEDGTYIRLRNISLGYTLPKTLVEKMGMTKLRVYVAGQNLVTWTKYTGYDPEVGNNGLSTRGIDKGTYPVSSQVRAGIQLEF
ncbi:TonB-dependent receptor [Polaribacter sp. Z014]|uniref:SusC/RagA family TonB-linked outer membrane protein n=1 Tax=Polaribacter sp. Z014 TaxID=2927126 RepID=UPI00201FBE9B|nr:TonB-dependent receptor [Polaribacter sp. Z014]MCL7765070.1 TonB-dependent receptor [Polaribacter sp. Z014]